MKTSVEIDRVDLSAFPRGEFHIFRKTNIIEFKNPDDELSEGVLWKVVDMSDYIFRNMAYLLIKSLSRSFGSVKFVKIFKEMTQFADADETKGIYHIRNWKVDFSIQAIVSRELEGKERRIPRNNEKSKAGKHPADNGRDKRNHGPDPSRLVSGFHGTTVKAG